MVSGLKLTDNAAYARYTGHMISEDASSRPLPRAEAFCAKYGLKLPVVLAPMAGACPTTLSIAVANAGGMGAMGAGASTS